MHPSLHRGALCAPLTSPTDLTYFSATHTPHTHSAPPHWQPRQERGGNKFSQRDPERRNQKRKENGHEEEGISGAPAQGAARCELRGRLWVNPGRAEGSGANPRDLRAPLPGRRAEPSRAHGRLGSTPGGWWGGLAKVCVGRDANVLGSLLKRVLWVFRVRGAPSRINGLITNPSPRWIRGSRSVNAALTPR